MADIQRDIDQITTARYGREVRGSIVNALTLMNEESSEAIDKAVTAQDSASASAEEARTYADRLVDLSGGNANQVLTKNSNADFDYSWQNSQGGGGGASDAYEVTYGDTNVGDTLDGVNTHFSEVDASISQINTDIGQINNDLSDIQTALSALLSKIKRASKTTNHTIGANAAITPSLTRSDMGIPSNAILLFANFRNASINSISNVVYSMAFYPSNINDAIIRTRIWNTQGYSTSQDFVADVLYIDVN